MIKIEDSYYSEEVRSGYTVSAKMKRVWAVELQILDVFDTFCKKHNLKYWAGYGTLLGAIRHQGMIPWDDDIDLVMLRTDYEYMREHIQKELPEYYFFQDSYSDVNIMPFCKIRDSRTTAYEKKFTKDANQGIFIDIFPFDDVYENENDKIHEIEKEIYQCMMTPEKIIKRINNKSAGLLLPTDILIDLMNGEPREQFRAYEDFLRAHCGISRYVGYVIPDREVNAWKSLRENYCEMHYVPFEMTTIPIPRNAEVQLFNYYGDFMRPVIGGSTHEDVILEPDIPYEEFYKSIDNQ